MEQPPKKKKRSRAELMFKDQNGQELWKAPGSLEGSQFVMANLEGCQVHVLDHTSQVNPVIIRLPLTNAITPRFIWDHVQAVCSSETVTTVLFTRLVVSLGAETCMTHRFTCTVPMTLSLSPVRDSLLARIT